MASSSLAAPSAMARLILGESIRTLDPRYRLSIPPELAETLAAEGGECILAKERPGCLSLWNVAQWKARLDAGVKLIETKIEAGRLEGRVEDVQRLGRLLSTRQREVQLAGRGRLVLPEGFREFLGVEPGGEVMVVGAAVCVEIWNPEKWSHYVGDEMPAFRQLLEGLSS
jgi:transcriptional regulator MraZ